MHSMPVRANNAVLAWPSVQKAWLSVLLLFEHSMTIAQH